MSVMTRAGLAMIAQRIPPLSGTQTAAAEQFDLLRHRAYHGLFDCLLNELENGVMVTRRRAVALSVLAAFLGAATLSAQQAAAPRKLTKAEEKERDAIYALLDPAKTGAAPNDLSLSWVRQDILKSSQNQQYVPFILSIDPSKTTQKQLTVYWRVVSTAPPPAPPAAADGRGGNNNQKPAAAKPTFAFEQINTANVAPVDGGVRISRAFQVLPGNYDVFVIVKEPTPEKAPKNAPPIKASVVKKNI